MTSFDVLVIGAAIEHNVAISRGLAGLRVVVDFVGIENVRAIVNFGLAAQLKHGAVLLLLEGANGNLFIFQGRWRCRPAWRRDRLADGRKQLAGNYRRRE